MNLCRWPPTPEGVDQILLTSLKSHKIYTSNNLFIYYKSFLNWSCVKLCALCSSGEIISPGFFSLSDSDSEVCSDSSSDCRPEDLRGPGGHSLSSSWFRGLSVGSVVRGFWVILSAFWTSSALRSVQFKVRRDSGSGPRCESVSVTVPTTGARGHRPSGTLF